ncbi:ATP-dependent dethiobiotin synthetase BioD [Desulforhopalus vacuolatus]|nr:dethiobiotin synthase [Desulforhopalus vacuolatus]MBM9520069.1 ATP-dependent dethiobiotin synthetase BioD [Desulforhopalus vacuolatus]
MKKVYVVSGIDTDIGKTVATGIVATALQQAKCSVITQKFVQTGCTGISEDILVHRQLMGIEPTENDRSGLTCPGVFPDPCSPHLAASLVGKEIDLKKIEEASRKLLEQYDILLLEGAGGLSVPLRRDFLFIDWLMEKRYPLLLVTSPRLGSINHTLGALELCKWREINIAAVLYNVHGCNVAPAIVEDSRTMIERYLWRFGFAAPVLTLQSVGKKQPDFRFLGNGC